MSEARRAMLYAMDFDDLIDHIEALEHEVGSLHGQLVDLRSENVRLHKTLRLYHDQARAEGLADFYIMPESGEE